MAWFRRAIPTISILLAILGMASGALLWVSSNIAAAAVQTVENRVTSLEAHREDDARRLLEMHEQLTRIERKLDDLKGRR